jgi:hypothetical protein
LFPKQEQKLNTKVYASLVLAFTIGRGWADPPDTTRTATSQPTASSATEETSVGGYGEIGYNHSLRSSGTDQIDLKRLVVFLSHRFDSRWSLYSEIEWEHAIASADDRGESEIEQAWLNFSVSSGINLKAGLFLMPLGILNQSHEPPVFFGVERNEVETRIIPTTWREGGVGIYGATASGIGWDLGVVTGFDLAKMDDAGAPLASSHQELQLARAEDFSAYGALNYQGIPGLAVGTSVFVGNSLQGNADHAEDPALPDFSGLDGLLALGDVHARWRRRGWDVQALYALGHIGEAKAIDERISDYNGDPANAGAEHPFVPESFQGWLVQAAWTVWSPGDLTLTPFVRVEGYDTQLSMPEGFAADPANADEVLTAGLSLKPISAIVVKADYQKFRKDSSKDRLNLGLGWMF